MPSVGQWLASINPLSRLEGELLLSEYLKLSRSQIIAFPETNIDAACAAQLDRAMDRVSAGEPLAYILGRREFWGLELTVSPAVLVPRPETELLVELVSAQAIDAGRVLELGTGSGAIAIALAHQRGDLNISATDVSADALGVAKTNATRLGYKICFFESDWFDQVAGEFDVIVSNPPYIAADDPHLPGLAHEPQIALVASDDGLQALRHIAQQASHHLTTNGLLVLEHGYDQGETMLALLAELGYQEINAHHDLAQHHRATSGRVRCARPTGE